MENGTKVEAKKIQFSEADFQMIFNNNHIWNNRHFSNKLFKIKKDHVWKKIRICCTVKPTI